jgi:hypothetical protein
MKKHVCGTILAVCLLTTLAIPGFAGADQDQNSSGDHQSASMSHNRQSMMNMSEMMGPGHEKRQKDGTCSHGMMGSGHGMMNMDSDMMGSGHGMMGMMSMKGMDSGMMSQPMEQMFFLDQADALGLTADQIYRLKTIHADCRRDNIRNMAEARIARLDLHDLLTSENWTLKDAEPLIRKVEKLDADQQVRQLQAISSARQVLSAEQLKKAASAQDSDHLEGLFN